MHYKSKSGYKRRMGHRQPYTQVKITGIKAARATTKKAPATKAASNDEGAE
jgi:hypothetical protein